MAKRRHHMPFAKSKQSLLFLAVSIAILLLMLSSGGFFSQQSGGGMKATLDSAQIRREGLKLYNANCLNCHGVNGRSTSFGPALIDPIYHADRLSDQDFVHAVLYGAPQRNWNYGPMEPVKGLTQVQIAEIMAYVRSQQKDAKSR